MLTKEASRRSPKKQPASLNAHISAQGLKFVAALLSVAAVATPAPASDLDLAKLSGEIYNQSYSWHPSYAKAKAAVSAAIPLGMTLAEARQKLELAGMDCANGKMPGDLRCRATMLESFEYRDYSSIIWKIDLHSTQDRVSHIDMDIS